MNMIVSSIDGSPSAAAVCDYSAWASLRLAIPVTLLHVLEKSGQVVADLSGRIGLGSREYLLKELADLDEKRGRLARENGQLLLEAAKQRLDQGGVAQAKLLQRHGNLVDSLKAMEDDIRLLVIGRQGEQSESALNHIGSNVENVMRTLHRPLLVVPGDFVEPQRFLLAFDASPNSRRVVERLVQSPLLDGLDCHLLMVAEPSAERQAELDWASDELRQAGYNIYAGISPGNVEDMLEAYCHQHAISLMVMGAYGHSRIRQFFVGSTTINMLRRGKIALLTLY